MQLQRKVRDSEGTGILVDVVIVNWNGRHHLDDCLSSLLNQTYEHMLVTLVDNGSNDGSIDWVHANYPEVTVIALAENFGFCKPNNMGIQQGIGKYVCLLNNDTRLDDKCVEIMVNAMENDSSIGICDAKQLLFGQPDVVFSTGAGYTVVGSNEIYNHLTPNIGLDDIRDCFIGMAACAIYRRSMLDKIGLLDEDFFAGREDVDISFRAHLSGYRVVNAGSALCYHKISATRGTSSHDYVRRGQRNLHWVYFKNMPSLLLLKYLPLHIVYTLLTALYFFRTGHGLAWIQSKFDFLRSLPALLRKRKQVQANRVLSSQDIGRLLSHQWMFQPEKIEKMRRSWKS